MGDDLLLGIAVAVACVMVQRVVVAILLRVLMFLEQRHLIKPDPFRSLVLLTVFTLIMHSRMNTYHLSFGGSFENFRLSF